LLSQAVTGLLDRVRRRANNTPHVGTKVGQMSSNELANALVVAPGADDSDSNRTHDCHLSLLAGSTIVAEVEDASTELPF
jgi:hypothetical protein